MKGKNVFLYFLFFVIIWINDDSFMFGVNDNKRYILIKYIVYFGLIMFLLLRNFKGFNRSLVILLFLIILLVCLSSLYNFDPTGGYIYQIMIFFLSFLMVKEIKFSIFTLLFNKFIYFLSLISVVVFLFVLFFPDVLNFFPIASNYLGVRSYNLFLCVVFEGDGYSMRRNTGIFREPGVFVIYLNIAIIFSLFCVEKLNRKHLLVYCITIITTMSTAGIIVAGVILFLSFMFDKKKYSSNDKYLTLVFLILSVVYFQFNENLSNQVFGKLNSSSGQYASTMARIVSLVTPIIVFINNPILGSGLSSFSIEFQKYSNSYFGIDFISAGTATNTIINKFATYGVLFGTIFIYAFYRFSNKILGYRKKIMSFLLFLLLLALFSNEDMRYSLLYNMIFFYSFLPLQYNQTHDKTSPKRLFPA